MYTFTSSFLIFTGSIEFHLQRVEETLKWSKFYLRAANGWPEHDTIITRAITYFSLGSCVLIFIWQHIFLFQGHWGNLEYVISVYATLLTVVQVFCKIFCMYYYKSITIQLLHTVRYEFWPLGSYEKEFKQMWRTMVWINRIVLFYAVSAIIFVAVWMAFPYADPLPGFRKMPILCWYPYDINKSPIHEITWLWIAYVGIYVSVGVPGYDMLFSFFLMHLCAQYRLLKVAFSSINKENRSDDAASEQIYKDMSFCVEYHIKLNNFSRDIQKIYNLTFTFGLLIAAGCICILFYLIQEEENPEKQIKLFGYFICLVVQISLYCGYGSALQYVSVEVGNGAYESGWYSTHPRFRLGLIHVIRRSAEPQRLVAGLAYLENETLVSIFRTAFSVSTLMRSMK